MQAAGYMPVGEGTGAEARGLIVGPASEIRCLT